MLSKVFCMRLNTYGMVVGWLGVIFSFLAVILLSVALGFSDEIAQQIVDNSKGEDITVDQVHTILVVVLSVYLAMKVINLLSSAMLVVGTVKERHLLLLPWLINNGVMLGFAILAHLGMWGGVISSPRHFLDDLPILLFFMAALALVWYLYYGIYSLFKQLQVTSDVQRPLITPAASQQTNSYPSYTKI